MHACSLRPMQGRSHACRFNGMHAGAMACMHACLHVTVATYAQHMHADTVCMHAQPTHANTGCMHQRMHTQAAHAPKGAVDACRLCCMHGPPVHACGVSSVIRQRESQWLGETAILHAVCEPDTSPCKWICCRYREDCKKLLVFVKRVELFLTETEEDADMDEPGWQAAFAVSKAMLEWHLLIGWVLGDPSGQDCTPGGLNQLLGIHRLEPTTPQEVDAHMWQATCMGGGSRSQLTPLVP